MDQSSSQTDIQQSELLSDSTTANKKSGWMYAFFAATIILLLGFTLAIYNFKNTNNSKVNSVTQNRNVEVDENPKPTDVGIMQSDIQKSMEELSTTPKLFMGAYTFDYPSKWHIANQWPNNESDPITIFLDPNPLNFAPRGGPLSAVRITDLSGKPNPDELFEAKRNEFKLGLKETKEEQIDSKYGPIYHYSGKIDFYMTPTFIEGYFFQIQGGSDDLINKHNIFVTADVNEGYSDIIRKIATSFKQVSK